MRIAMSILSDIGDAVEAEEMADIVHVHTDSGFYLGDAGLEFVEHLAELEGKVSVPTTMNNTSFDLERGISYGVSQDLFAINASPFSMIAKLSSLGVKSSIKVFVYRLR